jgi:hypothetical protein
MGKAASGQINIPLSVSPIKILINFKSGRAKIFPTADDTPISLVLPPINLIYAFLAFF